MNSILKPKIKQMFLQEQLIVNTTNSSLFWFTKLKTGSLNTFKDAVE